VEYLALCISILSLTVSSVAYFRSGGARDIRALEQRLNENVERLNAIAHRVSDSVAGRLRAGYMQSIRMISDLQSQVVGLKEKAAEEVNEDLRKLAQTLDAGRAGGPRSERAQGRCITHDGRSRDFTSFGGRRSKGATQDDRGQTRTQLRTKGN